MRELYKLIIQTCSFVIFLLVSITCIAQQNSFSKTSVNQKPKDSTVKSFYDANTNELNLQDSSRAKYYRIINFRDKKIFGPVITYFETGRPYIIANYIGNNPSKGFENGQFIRHYENGKIFQSFNYVNGLIDGVFLEFYPSGAKKASVSFSKGDMFGCQYSWDENGNLTKSGFFENGILNNSGQCNTDIDQQIKKESTPFKKLETPTGQNNTNDNDYDCQKKNFGEFCFTNSRQRKLIISIPSTNPIFLQQI